MTFTLHCLLYQQWIGYRQEVGKSSASSCISFLSLPAPAVPLTPLCLAVHVVCPLCIGPLCSHCPSPAIVPQVCPTCVHLHLHRLTLSLPSLGVWTSTPAISNLTIDIKCTPWLPLSISNSHLTMHVPDTYPVTPCCVLLPLPPCCDYPPFLLQPIMSPLPPPYLCGMSLTHLSLL